MSTDTYGIRILAKTGRELTLKVFAVYYDDPATYGVHIPASKDFFLMALWEKADEDAGDPLAAEFTVAEVFDDETLYERADDYIVAVEKLGDRNYPLDRTQPYATFYYERGGQWQDEDRLAQRDFCLTVTDERWLRHLAPGMSWGSTAYGTPG